MVKRLPDGSKPIKLRKPSYLLRALGGLLVAAPLGPVAWVGWGGWMAHGAGKRAMKFKRELAEGRELRPGVQKGAGGRWLRRILCAGIAVGALAALPIVLGHVGVLAATLPHLTLMAGTTAAAFAAWRIPAAIYGKRKQSQMMNAQVA